MKQVVSPFIETDEMTTDLEPLFEIDEMAADLKVKKSWLYAQSRQKGLESIPVLRVGKYLRFEPGKVRLWLRRRNVR